MLERTVSTKLIPAPQDADKLLPISKNKHQLFYHSNNDARSVSPSVLLSWPSGPRQSAVAGWAPYYLSNRVAAQPS